MTGRLELRGIRVLGTHGVPAEERARPQPFSVDADVWLDLERASVSDALEDTVDYGAVAELIATAVSTTTYQLVEALAADVARRVLDADAKVVRVDVTLRKVRPPVALDMASVGVFVSVRRD